MKTTLATLVLAAALLGLGASEASAWVCRAAGIGVTTVARDWYVVRAKFKALRRCEWRSPVPICTIVYCLRDRRSIGL